jgi:hypothetical protein
VVAWLLRYRRRLGRRLSFWPGRVRLTWLSRWRGRGGLSRGRRAAALGKRVGLGSWPNPFWMILGGPAHGRSGRACLQHFQPGDEGPLVGCGGGKQHLRAHQLKQQPR